MSELGAILIFSLLALSFSYIPIRYPFRTYNIGFPCLCMDIPF